MERKVSILLICLLVASFIPMNSAYGYYMDEYLDIKIGKTISNSDYITISSENGFYIYDKNDKERILTQIIDRDIIISSNGYGDMDILDFNNNIIRTIPGDGSEIIGSGSMYDSVIEIGKNQYRGFITFLSGNTGINLINHIEVEDYLYGVVPKEMGHSFHIESLKAQSVAARNFSMASKNKHQNEGFNLCDGEHCQVYGGKTVEHPNTNRAVDETRGLYLYYDGKLAETVYSSNNGGYIESSKGAWGGHLDYLIAKEDPFSKNTNASTWELEFTNIQLSEKIKSAGINIGDILDIEIIERTEGNRVVNAKLKGTLGEEVISGSKLRSIFEMRSTWFDIGKDGSYIESVSRNGYVYNPETLQTVIIDLNNASILNGDNEMVKPLNTAPNNSKVEGFTFKGRGYGHGVGMSQYGALEMAKQGYSFEEILKHYYSGTQLVFNR